MVSLGLRVKVIHQKKKKKKMLFLNIFNLLPLISTENRPT